MDITLIIPHYKTGKMTAYAVSQYLKYKGRHNLTIIVSDNHAGDESIEYLFPFLKDNVVIVEYPFDKLQSHGISIDRVLELGLVRTPYFITAESDSFPTREGYLDYYEGWIAGGVDMAGSELSLSGGRYIHPCGALYSTKLWQEAKAYCDNVEYSYFPNLGMKEGFACHMMVHKSILIDLMDAPEDYVEISDSYKKNGLPSREKFIEQLNYYKPVVNPFHNGMGMLQESVKTYGRRTIDSDSPYTLLNNKAKLIFRVGYEPGQWLSYYSFATGKQVFNIPTETKWMEGRENEQQEYTLNSAGIKHLWGISAYHDLEGGDEVVKKVKQSLPDQLYATLPTHQKITK